MKTITKKPHIHKFLFKNKPDEVFYLDDDGNLQKKQEDENPLKSSSKRERNKYSAANLHQFQSHASSPPPLTPIFSTSPPLSSPPSLSLSNPPPPNLTNPSNEENSKDQDLFFSDIWSLNEKSFSTNPWDHLSDNSDPSNEFSDFDDVI